jgi:hypothetical protein
MKRYRTPEAFRRALATFVERRKDELKVPLEVLRRRIVFPRFLARLLSVAPDSWMLTGGMALDLRLMQRPDFQRRTTVDLDFLYRQTRKTPEADLIAATQVDLHDYFVFAVTPTAGAHDKNLTSLPYNGGSTGFRVGRDPALRSGSRWRS